MHASDTNRKSAAKKFANKSSWHENSKCPANLILFAIKLLTKTCPTAKSQDQARPTDTFSDAELQANLFDVAVDEGTVVISSNLENVSSYFLETLRQ